MKITIPLRTGRRITLFLAGFVIFYSGVAAATTEDKLRAVLEAKYAGLKSAMAERDGKIIATFLAPDFVSVDVSGHEGNAAEMISEVEMLPKDPAKTSKTRLVSIIRDNDKAIVDQHYDMKTIKTAADGSRLNAELITVSTDIWMHVNGDWLLQRTVTRQMDYLIGSRQVVHKVSTSVR